MTVLSALSSFGSAGRRHRDRLPARPRQCPGPPCRPNHPPSAARSTLPSSDLPAVDHAREGASPASNSCVLQLHRIASKTTAGVGKAGRPVDVSRTPVSRFDMEHTSTIFASLQRKSRPGSGRPAVCRKRSPTPAILAVPPRYGARSRFLLISSVTTQAHRHVTLPLRPRGGIRRVCPRRHRCAMDESLGESGASARPQRWGDSAVSWAVSQNLRARKTGSATIRGCYGQHIVTRRWRRTVSSRRISWGSLNRTQAMYPATMARADS